MCSAKITIKNRSECEEQEKKSKWALNKAFLKIFHAKLRAYLKNRNSQCEICMLPH